ncbi:SDR family NAD(P)-dependent oxidoreductase [Amycolatopsis thermophila]|uniref:NAD(P)-dependent dehydrogenase (Short-subunit alcohol dehydrogenase family) n=1 Tax=Amycolatopsis thermophila TaxID=206084 RepID=A0ABU0F6S4_9PSEU|nr:SDR family NAD(P)-dependent oxidoreductase [Amycolatopsis thermophila]MDQ0383108.1 NAD(P)-dependent dehydrogenase (short-subunit alcohol dehydrogenase family) [Amycolatopsis thermophila]
MGGVIVRVCLVTGASSGIGRVTALELLRAGHTVYGAARRVPGMDAIRAAGGHVLRMDARDGADLDRAVATVVAEQGRIDVLVNNAGTVLHGAVEDVPLDRARDQLEVNLIAPARLIQLVLPHMRAQRSGTIVNVSSIGGEIALPLGAWYYAAKHALEALSDTLRMEVAPFGVDVVIIQPGISRRDGAAREDRPRRRLGPRRGRGGRSPGRGVRPSGNPLRRRLHGRETPGTQPDPAGSRVRRPRHALAPLSTPGFRRARREVHLRARSPLRSRAHRSRPGRRWTVPNTTGRLPVRTSKRARSGTVEPETDFHHPPGAL